MDFPGVFKEVRWYCSARMVRETVERKFLDGCSTYLDWRGACIVPMYKG